MEKPTLKNPHDKKSQGSETIGGFTNKGSSELERWVNQILFLKLKVIKGTLGVESWLHHPPTESKDGEDRAGRLVRTIVTIGGTTR